MKVKIIECPRDAMQGLHELIATKKKIKYLNHLLKAGFDTLDFGSFVSPKAIPQMADTEQVLEEMETEGSKTKLLAIIANLKGAEIALKHKRINYLGFPFSISETFQLRNTHSTIRQSLDTVYKIQSLCQQQGKELVIYISMGFGNPYGDPWNPGIAEQWVAEIAKAGIHTISLSDTIGIADPPSITHLFSTLIPRFPQIEFGAHLHTTPTTWEEKVKAAYNSGCLRFDGAIKGFGGCPMAADELTGNMATENLLSFFENKNVSTGIDKERFQEAMLASTEVFGV